MPFDWDDDEQERSQAMWDELQYPRTFYTDLNGLFCKVII
jgi:hypothetical protein